MAGFSETLQLFIGVLVILATAAPFVRSRRWYWRFFDFPRAQIFSLGVLVLASGLAAAPGMAATHAVFMAVSACVALQALKLAPYVKGSARPLPSASRDRASHSVSFLISNVYMENRESGPLLAALREKDPDVVIVVETDEWWLEQLSTLETGYPELVKVPQDNTYGMAVYTRLPVEHCEVRFLTDPGVPSVFMTVRLADVLVDIHAVHPRPPTVGRDTTPRDRELDVIAGLVKSSANPSIVAGDLNDVAWSHSTQQFQQASGLLDPRMGRGFFNSYNAKLPLVRWPLDHIFVDRRFHLVEMKRLPHVGSDHFPISASFRYVGDALPYRDSRDG